MAAITIFLKAKAVTVSIGIITKQHIKTGGEDTHNFKQRLFLQLQVTLDLGSGEIEV
jgi:hypothetical protein